MPRVIKYQLSKKMITFFLIILLVLSSFFCAKFIVYGQNYISFSNNKNIFCVYFLAIKEDNYYKLSTDEQEQILLSGASVVYTYSNDNYIIINCYETKEDCELIRNNLSHFNLDIICLESTLLYSNENAIVFKCAKTIWNVYISLFNCCKEVSAGSKNSLSLSFSLNSAQKMLLDLIDEGSFNDSTNQKVKIAYVFVENCLDILSQQDSKNIDLPMVCRIYVKIVLELDYMIQNL